jgi:hypothetical protein
MDIDDAISEFVGALAELEVKNKSGALSKTEACEVFRLLKIENSQGEDYKQLGGILKKAHTYWAEKDRPSVVDNIKKTLPF